MDYLNASPVRHIRVFTSPKTGDSALEETLQAPTHVPLMSTTVKAVHDYDFGAARKVQIVVAPPGLFLPMHAAPYRESFLMLEGSVMMELGDGTRRELLPGDMTTFEDLDASKGHGGRIGPCGYVALNIVP